MSENNKEIMNIGINGGSVEHRIAIALMLEDFLEFTGFEASIQFDTELSDDDFEKIMEEFPDRIVELTNTTKINVHEII